MNSGEWQQQGNGILDLGAIKTKSYSIFFVLLKDILLLVYPTMCPKGFQIIPKTSSDNRCVNELQPELGSGSESQKRS
jgi:hypothetical protein